MKIKYILGAALITPLLTVSSMAQQYVGGPKSGISPATQISSGVDIYAQGTDVYSPGGDFYAPAVRTRPSHVYRGGAKVVVPRDR